MLVDERVCQAHGLEHLGGVIPLHGRDAHLRHDGYDAGDHRLVVVALRLGCAKCDYALLAQLGDRVVREVGVDPRRRITHERCEVVRGDGVPGFNDDVGMRAKPAPKQVVVYRCHCEQRRDGHAALACAVGYHDQVGT